MSNSVNNNLYAFTTSDGQKRNLLDLAVSKQTLNMSDRFCSAWLSVKVILGRASEEDENTKDLYAAIQQVTHATSKIFALCASHDCSLPHEAFKNMTLENAVTYINNHQFFNESLKNIRTGLDELQKLQFTLDETSLNDLKPEALIRDIVKEAFIRQGGDVNFTG